MLVDVINFDNKKVGEVTLAEQISSEETRQDIFNLVVTWQLAKRRQGTQSARTRSEVSGTTAKPFKQKGTGNARQGSKKGPHQVGGGVAHAVKPRSYEFKLNKKLRAKALRSVVATKAREGNLIVLESAVVDSAKTKDLQSVFNKLNWGNALVVRGDNAKDNFYLAQRSIKFVDQLAFDGLNVYDILRQEKLVFTKHAFELLNNKYAA